MAKIFLSYAREDSAKAERVAVALEQAGHAVWWDREIDAGSSFSSAIDSALSDCEIVLVLWSKHSVRSDWVRDEAANGRDSGRLLPALIEAVDPPMGFRQYQAVTLFARGREPLAPLLKAIDRKIGQNGTPPRQGATVRPARQLPRPSAIAVIALILIAAASGAWWWTRSEGGAGNTISVAATGGNAGQSEELARSLSRDLGRFRAGPLGSLTILEGDDAAATKANYRVEVGVSGSSGDLQADVALKHHGDSGLLWSSLIPEPHGRMIDLRQQVSAQVGDVLNCLAELAGDQHELKGDALSLFLRGCALGNEREAVAIFQDLVKREPKSGHGWAGLALVASWQVAESLDVDQRKLIAIATDALAKAKIYGPNLPETAVANANVYPGGGEKILRTLRLLDQAMVHNPNSPLLSGTRTTVLTQLGRMHEAVAESRQGFDLNPLSPALLELHASTLAYSGNVEAAFESLAEAEKSWPASARLAEVRYRLNLRYGNPAQAADYLRTSGYSTSPGDLATTLAFLKARTEPNATNIDKALTGYRARFARDPADVPAYLQALAIFGRIDEAYATLSSDIAVDSIASSSDILFRSFMDKFRADPRFILLAKKIGLVDDWEKTGIWPDFCDQPGLPYDCQAEAAKVKNVAPIPVQRG